MDSDAKLDLATLPPLLILPSSSSQNTASHCATRHGRLVQVKLYLESIMLLVGHHIPCGHVWQHNDIGVMCNPFLKEVLTSYF